MSKRILFSKILHSAQKFREYEKIYYPVQLDFRGRVYCVPAFLNYQSIGGAKALLEFAVGKEITKENRGDFWLAVHGANTWGYDKVSPKGSNGSKITLIGLLLAVKTLLLTCNGQMLTALISSCFCNEWAQFMEQGDGFVSHIPVAVDGSCNGLQLYSLMLKDEKQADL